MRRHDIRFPLRGRVWAAVPFFCACLCVESGLPSRFFCARTRAWERSAVRSIACRQRVEYSVGAGRNCAACRERNLRSVRGGMCGRRGLLCGGGGRACAAGVAGGRRHVPVRCRRLPEAGRVGICLQKCPPGAKGFRETGCIRRGALAAASRAGWKAHPGVGGKTKSGFREKTAFVV